MAGEFSRHLNVDHPFPRQLASKDNRHESGPGPGQGNAIRVGLGHQQLEGDSGGQVYEHSNRDFDRVPAPGKPRIDRDCNYL
jgi:hypothetical protein